jgi:hypothetical protein
MTHPVPSTPENPMKVLNLDALAGQIEKSITVNGVEYMVEEMSVQDFILASKEAETLKASDPIANLESWMTHIRRVIPSLPEEELRKLKLPHLMLVMQFVTSTIEDEADAGKTAQQAPEGSIDPN